MDYGVTGRGKAIYQEPFAFDPFFLFLSNVLFSRMYLASVFIFLSFVAAGTLRAEYTTLKIKRGPAPGSVTLSGSGSGSGSQRVELSYGLKEWWPVFVEPEASAWSWDWDEVGYLGRGFFRLVEVQPPAIPSHPSWKNRITLPRRQFFISTACRSWIIERAGRSAMGKIYPDPRRFAQGIFPEERRLSISLSLRHRTALALSRNGSGGLQCR